MIYLDTNTIARSVEPGHAHQQPALQAMRFLAARDNERFVISPQVLTEFYAAATRAANSLSLTPQQALTRIQMFKAQFTPLPESPAIFTLESLLAKYHPTNRRVFDTRHVAIMLAHGLSKILTFNDADFSPFSEIQPLNPFDLLGLPRA
jgi:predicted nucleic acid-binding protein